MNQVLYLYCVADAGLVAALEGTGVDGKVPISLQRFQDLVAVLSTVSLEEFSGEAAERNLTDLSWVGPSACRHAEVVAQASRFSPVLPLRFGTIFSSPKALQRFLVSHHDAIREFLGRVADQEEWSVKGILDRSRAKGAILDLCLADQEDRLAALPPGRRYLEEQRLQGRAEGELNGWLKGACHTITTDLGIHATDCRQRRTLPHGGPATEMILNLAFLIPHDKGADFLARIELANAEYAPQGLSFLLSGPWPPYSFSPELNQAGRPGSEIPPP